MPANKSLRIAAVSDGNQNKAKTLIKSLLSNDNTPENAVIIEIDYKGYYSRFALTLDEFEKYYRTKDPDIPPPDINGQSHTCRPLVHMYYKIAAIDSHEWNRFFTDMKYGLPESDITNGNLASVDLDECFSLKNKIKSLIDRKEK